MDEEEIERLIAELRAALVGAGFGWAAAQAEEGVPRGAAAYSVALALIDAAEGVSVDLADVEIKTLDRLGVDDVHFKPDEEVDIDGASASSRQDRRASEVGDQEHLRGKERRGLLEELRGRRSMFNALRRLLDGGE